MTATQLNQRPCSPCQPTRCEQRVRGHAAVLNAEQVAIVPIKPINPRPFLRCPAAAIVSLAPVAVSTRAIPVDNVTCKNSVGCAKRFRWHRELRAVSPKRVKVLSSGCLRKNGAARRVRGVDRGIRRDRDMVELHRFRQTARSSRRPSFRL